MPLRALLALLAAVLLAHGMLLSGYPTALSAAAGPTAAMNTRQIEAASSTLATVPPPATPVATAPAPAPLPVTAGPRKKVLPSASLKPNPPLAQAEYAGTASEIIAKTEPLAMEPSPAPTVPALAPPDEPTPLASAESATASSAAPDTAASTPTAATTTAATTTVATTPTLTAAELAKREADKAQRRALKLEFPASSTLSYNAMQTSGGQPKNGSGTLKWTSDGSEYQLRLEASLLGYTVLSQSSVGKLGAEGLQPERFSDKRGFRSEKAAHFQRDAGKITFSGKQTSAALQPGAQDRLSLWMQLAAMAAGGAAQLAQAGQITFQVSNTEEADTWVFLVQASEKIQVPAGEVMALHLVRNPRKEFDSRLELWLAPSLGYLPARFLQTEANGNTLELQLRSPILR
jgi:Protein of unknown function (DUF3108)